MDFFTCLFVVVLLILVLRGCVAWPCLVSVVLIFCTVFLLDWCSVLFFGVLGLHGV